MNTVREGNGGDTLPPRSLDDTVSADVSLNEGRQHGAPTVIVPHNEEPGRWQRMRESLFSLDSLTLVVLFLLTLAVAYFISWILVARSETRIEAKTIAAARSVAVRETNKLRSEYMTWQQGAEKKIDTATVAATSARQDVRDLATRTNEQFMREAARRKSDLARLEERTARSMRELDQSMAERVTRTQATTAGQQGTLDDLTQRLAALEQKEKTQVKTVAAPVVQQKATQTPQVQIRSSASVQPRRRTLWDRIRRPWAP